MEGYEGLIIKKGGKLVKSYWSKAMQEHLEEDVTNFAFGHLFENCILEDKVSLKDIFLILKANMGAAKVIIGNWVEEIVTEGLTGIPKLPEKGEEIEYLELYWTFSRVREYKPFPDGPRKPEPGSIHEKLNHEWTGDFTGPKSLLGYLQPDFHGVGPLLTEDRCFDWIDKETGKPAVERAKGTRVNWGIGCSKSCDIAHLPVILNKEICVVDDVVNKDWSKDAVEVYEGAQYSLGHILYGIIWEMSFYGCPEDRDELVEDLKVIAEDIKNNEGEFK